MGTPHDRHDMMRVRHPSLQVEEGGETVFPDPSAKWANPRLEALAANHSQVGSQWAVSDCTKATSHCSDTRPPCSPPVLTVRPARAVCEATYRGGDPVLEHQSRWERGPCGAARLLPSHPGREVDSHQVDARDTIQSMMQQRVYVCGNQTRRRFWKTQVSCPRRAVCLPCTTKGNTGTRACAPVAAGFGGMRRRRSV
jgi:hypothetical protein